jgi:DNA-binding MarR family transcriptional regulator
MTRALAEPAATRDARVAAGGAGGAACRAATRGLGARDAAAWSGLLRTRERLMHELDRELEQAHGLSLAEYDVLVQLGAAGERGLRMAELADAVLLTRSGLTRLVDRLEQQGLVARKRCPSDLRGMHAVLTGAGSARLDEAIPTHTDGIRRLFLDPLDSDDLDHLLSTWAKLDR